MATTNLNLGTIASSDLLSNFVSLFNANMTTLDKSLVSGSTNPIVRTQDDTPSNWCANVPSGVYYIDGYVLQSQPSTYFMVLHMVSGTEVAQIGVSLAYTGAKIYSRCGSNTRGSAWDYDWKSNEATLLWTNPSPTESFEAQTIATSSLAQPLSNFKFVRVHALMKTDYGREVSSTTRINVASSLQGYSSFGNQFFIRDYNVGTSGIDFANCYQVMTGGGTNNSSLIPVNIYGIV